MIFGTLKNNSVLAKDQSGRIYSRLATRLLAHFNILFPGSIALSQLAESTSIIRLDLPVYLTYLNRN